jgi:pimeloyl-ACP methyl ester carboxylesterase
MDSVPGNFVEPGRAAAFLDEAQAVLRRMAGGTEAAWRKAPVILVAYSGGYRTAAQILINGGIDRRIEGLVLLDAIFSDTGLYARWLDEHRQQAFLYALYSRSSAKETAELEAQLRLRSIPYAAEDDGGPMAGVRIVAIDTPHAEVPVKGPPAEPLGAVLRRLPGAQVVLPLLH